MPGSRPGVTARRRGSRGNAVPTFGRPIPPATSQKAPKSLTRSPVRMGDKRPGVSYKLAYPTNRHVPRPAGIGAADGEFPMNLIQQLEQEQVAKLSAGKEIPEFGPGDTVLVNYKVVEGERSRIQAYEGVCIGRAGAGLNENFTVRKISYGEGVERVFPLYSPMIDSIKVVRRGKVRRAKLYYLRGRRGKAARISEKQDHRDESTEAVEKAAG